MHVRNLHIRHGDFPRADCYPFNLPVLGKTGGISFGAPVSFFIGENGTGKSTLLWAMARRCGMHIWKEPDRRRVRPNRHEENLHRYLDVEWADGPVPGTLFASEIFKHFAVLLDEWASADPGQLSYFGDESLLTKSHGQCHMAYFKSRFKIKGLYLLDEPENALSPRRQIELLGVLKEAAARGHAQFVIATHSPILLALPGAEIFSFDAAPISTVRYEETDYYTIYKGFLEDRSRYLEG